LTERVISANWAAPANVHAFCTTRAGGVSTGPWSSFNLGTRCGDGVDNVTRNRAILRKRLPAEPQWLRQVHGARVVVHSGELAEDKEGDALASFQPGQVCAVLSADCLPVFFCSASGDRVAVAHAGWRGLAGGVLQATVEALDTDPARLTAWLGPAIGPLVYEVGSEVTAAFSGEFPNGFEPAGDRWLMNIYHLARLKLASAGVHAVFGGDYCTLSDPARFYSYRRDGDTGRMASLIWFSPD
jgi:YfiH family protein